MSRGIGRGRARGRGRGLLGLTVQELKGIPGSLQDKNTDTEDWECGIETSYPKSVVYNSFNEATFLAASQPDSAPSCIQNPSKYKPTVRDQCAMSDNGHNNDSNYGSFGFEHKVNSCHESANVSKERLKTATAGFDERVKSEIHPVSASVCTSSRSGFIGRPPMSEDEEDSDDLYDAEDYESWSFGSNVKSKSHATEETAEPVKSEFDQVMEKNPSVSRNWLLSLQQQGKKNVPGIRAPPETRQKAESKSLMWEEMKVFDTDNKNKAEYWLQRLEHQWCKAGYKYNVNVAEEIRLSFDSVKNPYSLSLFIIESTSDYRTAKASSLSFLVAKEFEKLTRNSPHMEKILEANSPALKIYAFYVGTRFHFTLFETIVKAFKLSSPGNDFLVNYVRPMFDGKRMKEAVHCISKLGLHKYFDTEKVLLPLILQDKVNLVESYVYQRKKQQIELLVLLDRLCDPETNLNKVADESGVEDIKYEKLQQKTIGKLAIRLLKLYQINEDVVPNVDRRRKLAALRFLIYKFYIEETLQRETWRELVEPSLEGNRWLQEQLIDCLVTSADINEAIWWSRKYKLPSECLPIQVVEAMDEDEQLVADGTAVQNEGWEDEPTKSSHYYKLNLPESEIFIIDTRMSYLNFISYIHLNTNVIGLDAEWRPSFGQNYSSRVALFQIATPTRAYLLDTLALSDALSPDDWIKLGEIFISDEIIKLGFGFDGDVKMLLKSIPDLRDGIKRSQRMVELCKLKEVVRSNPCAFKRADFSETDQNPRVLKGDEKGLSDLVRRCFGRPMDKAEQMSDWEKRPLRRPQIIYAALDAHVLIELYNYITDTCEMAGIDCNMEPLVNCRKEGSSMSKMQRRQMRVAEKSEEEKQFLLEKPKPREGPPIRPADLAVIVDTMVTGVGRYLRCCGVDVHIASVADDRDVLVKKALREKRVILTTGQPFIILRSHVPEGMCLHVSTGLKAKQQAIDVLNHFNVNVTTGDIFSRCNACNGDHYVKLRPEDVGNAWDIKDAMCSGEMTAKLKKRIVLQKDIAMGPRRDYGNLVFGQVNLSNITIGENVPLQVEIVPREVISQVPVFYCCDKCGKLYWEGKHFSDVSKQFSDVLNR